MKSVNNAGKMLFCCGGGAREYNSRLQFTMVNYMYFAAAEIRAYSMQTNISKISLKFYPKISIVLWPFWGLILSPSFAENRKMGILKLAISHQTSFKNGSTFSKPVARFSAAHRRWPPAPRLPCRHCHWYARLLQQ